MARFFETLYIGVNYLDQICGPELQFFGVEASSQEALYLFISDTPLNIFVNIRLDIFFRSKEHITPDWRIHITVKKLL